MLGALKPLRANPKGVAIDELFLEPPHRSGLTREAPHQKWAWFPVPRYRQRAPGGRTALSEGCGSARSRRAVDFAEERLNGEDGLGAIYPPMANIVMMYDALGYRPDFPPRAITRRGIDKLLVIGEDEAYCQPCVSPVWDTALTCHALLEAGGEGRSTGSRPRLADAAAGARCHRRLGGEASDVRPGGWAFQYNNAHYPDLDDTAVVVMAMDRTAAQPGSTISTAIARAREWIVGLQSRDGGWAAFDADNLEYYLNNIPFSDHGALLDPPTEDVTARCVSMLAQLGETAGPARRWRDGIDYLRRTQLADGSWYGRWGLNYIYGTWSVLCALNAAGVDHGSDDAQSRRLAGLDPERRWRLGRGRRQLQARLSRL